MKFVHLIGPLANVKKIHNERRPWGCWRTIRKHRPSDARINFDILNISPFSEYSSPWSRSSLSLTISSDLRIWPLCANKIILLSVIKTWYFLSPYRTDALLWNFTFSKGSKKSWSGMERYTVNIWQNIYRKELKQFIKIANKFNLK